jgi:putative phosphoesterase
MDIENRGQSDLTIGVVSDTHIPDRVIELHPDLIPGLQQAGVEMIFHAGDISTQKTLDQLSRVAPVEAVRGNRDIFTPRNIPFERRLDLNGVPVLLTHGHGSLTHYLWDKGIYAVKGYVFERYQQYLTTVAKQARVVVFGHTHRPANRLIDGTLFFNPGSAGPNYDNSQPSYGLLRIGKDGEVRGEIIMLANYPVVGRRWIKE